jgi:hypothetical protein
VYRQRFSEVRLETAAPRVFSPPAPVLLHVGRGLVSYRDSGLVRKETEDYISLGLAPLCSASGELGRGILCYLCPPDSSICCVHVCSHNGFHAWPHRTLGLLHSKRGLVRPPA